MANSSADSEGFVTVSKKKSVKGRRLPQVDASCSFLESVDVDTCLRHIEKAKEEVQASRFYKDFVETLTQLCELNNKIEEIVCWGLGRISTCKIAQYQLGFLLCLVHHCKDKPVLVYDPVHTETEKHILQLLRLQVLTSNCEGKRKAQSAGTTLFILPHCPRELSNNLLYSNWNSIQLQNCIIFANSFEKLRLDTPERFLKSYHYLQKVQTIVREIPIQNTFRYPDIFNDLSLHHFFSSPLDQPSEFWDTPEPDYSSNETELVSEPL